MTLVTLIQILEGTAKEEHFDMPEDAQGEHEMVPTVVYEHNVDEVTYIAGIKHLSHSGKKTKHMITKPNQNYFKMHLDLTTTPIKVVLNETVIPF